MDLDVCLINEAQEIDSILFSGDANFEPVGDISLEGSYDSDAESLCMSGSTSFAFPSTSTKLEALACFNTGDDDALALDTLSFDATVEIEPVGVVHFEGDYQSDTSLLCMLGETQFTLPGSEVKMMARACLDMTTPNEPSLESLVFSGNGHFEPVGAITFTRDYEGGELCLEGDTEQAFPGTSVMLRARTCLDTSNPTSPVLNSLSFHAEVVVDPVGEAFLSGTYATNDCVSRARAPRPCQRQPGQQATLCADMSGPTPILEEARFSGSLSAAPLR